MAALPGALCLQHHSPLLTLREVTVAKKSPAFSPKGPVGSNLNNHIIAGLTCYFASLHVL